MAHKYISALLAASFAFCAFVASAAIPVRWTTDTYRVKPLVYECYHGETLDLASALTAYGEQLNLSGKTARLYWQTNGMDSAWWQTNAVVRAESGATNILAATFSGAYDTGANETIGFIGVEGENYRAAFTLRFRASPGFTPSTLPTPTKKINWAAVENDNVDAAPFVVKGGEGGITASQVTNISSRVTSNIVTKAYVESLGISTGADTNAVNALIHSYDVTNLTARINAKQDTIADYTTTNAVIALAATQVTNNVAPWAMTGKSEPQGMTTNAVKDIASSASVTNLGAVAVAQAMTGNITFDHLKAKPTTISGYGITDGVTYQEIGEGVSLFFNQEQKKIYQSALCLTDYQLGFSAYSAWVLHPEAGPIETTLPDYLASTEWHGSNKSLSDYGITNTIPAPYVPSSTDPSFSNAVLSVALNIDTNSVAVLNEIAATFGGFPITGTATTVGGLLAALAAAIAWLRKRKIDTITCSGVADITTENGTANVSTLFSSANTSLTSTIGSTIAARCQSLDPVNSSISDVIKALKGIN